MSRFGEGILRDEGTDPLYVPHGVDTGIYKPGDRTAYRETVNEIDNDTFVIGLIASAAALDVIAGPRLATVRPSGSKAAASQS